MRFDGWPFRYGGITDSLGVAASSCRLLFAFFALLGVRFFVRCCWLFVIWADEINTGFQCFFHEIRRAAFRTFLVNRLEVCRKVTFWVILAAIEKIAAT